MKHWLAVIRCSLPPALGNYESASHLYRFAWIFHIKGVIQPVVICHWLLLRNTVFWGSSIRSTDQHFIPVQAAWIWPLIGLHV